MVLARSVEPTPPLKAVLDLPLRSTDTPAELLPRIDELSRAVRDMPRDGDWIPIYEEAIAIVELVGRDVDARFAEMQRRLLDAEDPNEAKQRTLQGPRREAERLRTEAKNAVQRVDRDWVDRSKRQLDQLLEKCLKSGRKSVAVTEKTTSAGLELEVDGTWWAEFLGYVGRCCDEWTRNVTTGVEADLEKATREATASLLPRTGGRGVSSPATEPAPPTEAKTTEELPEKVADVPSRGAALMRYVRSNIMAVSIFGTMFAVVIGVVFQMTSDDANASARPVSTMYVRGGLLLLVLPIVLFFGLRAGNAQREKLRQKAVEQHRKDIQTFLKGAVLAILERHRGALERWIHARAEAWAERVDVFWDDVLDPVLAEKDSHAAERIKELKLEQAKLAEEQQALKMARSQIGDKLLFDLRRRHRELVDGTG